MAWKHRRERNTTVGLLSEEFAVGPDGTLSPEPPPSMDPYLRGHPSYLWVPSEVPSTVIAETPAPLMAPETQETCQDAPEAKPDAVSVTAMKTRKDKRHGKSHRN